MQPFIYLNEHEESGIAECGCRLSHDEFGNAKFIMCKMHEAAPQLVKALSDIAAYPVNGNSESDVMADALDEIENIANEALVFRKKHKF